MPQYQGIWNLAQQSQALTSQQWVTDPLFKNTTLLLQADNAVNTAQNNTFIDSSPNSFAITRNGNTTQGSFSPFVAQQGAWSIFFNNANSDAIQLGTTIFDSLPASFTFEAWVWPTRYGGSASQWYNTCIFGKGATYMNWGLTSNGNLQLYHYDGSQRNNSSIGTVPLFQWSHVAAVVTGGVIYFYINGAASGTATWYGVQTAGNGTQDSFGYTADGNAGTNRYFGGYISNARFTKAAVYTSSFNPSQNPLTNSAAGTNSTFLIAQANRFIDASVSPITFTAFGGTPSIQSYCPFLSNNQWTASVVGGSGYFDGTGDFLSCTPGAIGSGDYYMECWVYPTATTQQIILDSRSSTDTNGTGIFINSSAQFQSFDGVTALTNAKSGTIVANTWYHVAVSRLSGVIRLFLNGAQAGTDTSNTTNFSNTTFKIGQAGSGANSYSGYVCGAKVVVGTGVSSVTLPTAPPVNTTNTRLLLNFTNAGIYDGTMKNNLETVGNAQVSTSVVKYGSGSMYFTGVAGTRIFEPTSQNYAFGTGDFTVELWVNPISQGGHGSANNDCLIDFRPNVASSAYGTLYIYSSGTSVNYYVSGAIRITGNAIPNNIWTHIALCRANGNTRLFINGVQAGSTYADTTNYAATSIMIGEFYDATGGGNFYGYMDDIRITKGIARYVRNFTPPTVALPRQ